eukprot:scaffold72023_cov31-Tisochrysis_lutea.AAC.4
MSYYLYTQPTHSDEDRPDWFGDDEDFYNGDSYGTKSADPPPPPPPSPPLGAVEARLKSYGRLRAESGKSGAPFVVSSHFSVALRLARTSLLSESRSAELSSSNEVTLDEVFNAGDGAEIGGATANLQLPTHPAAPRASHRLRLRLMMERYRGMRSFGDVHLRPSG